MIVNEGSRSDDKGCSSGGGDGDGKAGSEVTSASSAASSSALCVEQASVSVLIACNTVDKTLSVAYVKSNVLIHTSG